jgi:hypothetical protein
MTVNGLTEAMVKNATAWGGDRQRQVVGCRGADPASRGEYSGTDRRERKLERSVPHDMVAILMTQFADRPRPSSRRWCVSQ